MSAVAGKALKGTMISLVAQLGSQLLRFASNIVLARFLPDSAFGVNAMIFAVTTGLWLISDVGIGASVVRSAREDRDFVDTAWTLSVARGVTLFVIGSLLGPLAAWFYDEPELVWLLPFCSLMVLLLASESTRIYTATRNMAVGRVVAIELLSQVAALAVSIPIAIATKHVVALVAAAVFSAFVKFALSHLVLPGPRHRFVWDKAAIREIFSFGQWIFLSTLFSFLALRWDVFSLGRLEGFALLGVYGLASQITSVPNQISIQVTNTVLTPVLADAFRGSIDELRLRLAQARRAYLPAGALLFLGAATTAPAFFVVAYKEDFHAAGPMAQLLLLPAWLSFLQEASSRAMLAAGDGRGLAFTNALKVVATVLATLVGFAGWGFGGFVGGNAIGALVGVIVVGLRMRGHGVDVLAGDLGATGLFCVVGTVACGVPVLLEPVLGVRACWTTLGSCVLVCGPLAIVVLKHVRASRRGPPREQVVDESSR